ncbi:hypothetical protein QCE81_33515, partial [Caballeronia sp. LZ002]
RSRTPSKPNDFAFADGKAEAPIPSSPTRSTQLSWSALSDRSTRLACAWRTIFVSASSTMRKAAVAASVLNARSPVSNSCLTSMPWR